MPVNVWERHRRRQQRVHRLARVLVVVYLSVALGLGLSATATLIWWGLRCL